MILSNIFNLLFNKKNKILKNNQLTAIVPEGICPLCKKKDEICSCTIMNCNCNIASIKCDWPDCVCEACLEMPEMCRCKNE
tara:strand:+ start:108 stop:350 length:243 start_codon:yes stop_codon:yes gene_type:complete